MSYLVTIGRRTLLRALLLPVVFLLALPLTREVAAAPVQPSDQLSLLNLQTTQVDENDSSSPLRIQTQVGYTLNSARGGFLVLFTFEDSANRASGQSPAIPIQNGSGKVTLDVEYPPNPRVQAVSLLIGMFTEDKRMLGWLGTNPIPLSSLAGRVEFQQAMAARQEGNGKEAIERLDRAIELSPSVGSLYYWRADTHLRMGEYDTAIEDYSAALRLLPDHAASLVGRGIAYVWEGKWQSGIDDLTAALDVPQDPNPLTAWAHRARGVAYTGLGKYEEAVADYQAYLDEAADAGDRDVILEWISQLSGALGDGAGGS